MKKLLLLNLVLLFAATPFLLSQTSQTSPPPIPEEARKHFVMGTTLFKDAKTPDDYEQVESQFKQAVDLAPQWPDARYNLALAKEAAGDYSGAMEDLKLYQKFKLSENEARIAQDKIYALEAKAGAKGKKQAAEQNVATHAAAYQEMVRFLQGEWNYSSFNSAVASSGFASGHGNGKAYITIIGKEILVRPDFGYTSLKGTIAGDELSSISWSVEDNTGLGSKLPDYPVTVTIDKAGSHIHWRGPQKYTAGYWTLEDYTDVDLKR